MRILPKDWPVPDLKVPADEAEQWRAQRGLAADRPVVAFAPGAVGPSKRWPVEHFAELARNLAECGHVSVGARQPARKPARRANRARGRSARARPHLERSAQRDPRAEARHRDRVERFRPGACVGGDRHADRRHFRADQPVALGAAQSARRHHRDARPTCHAGRATSRPAGWCTTAACATSPASQVLAAVRSALPARA